VLEHGNGADGDWLPFLMNHSDPRPVLHRSLRVPRWAAVLSESRSCISKRPVNRFARAATAESPSCTRR
jgi:hypothetical protein